MGETVSEPATPALQSTVEENALVAEIEILIPGRKAVMENQVVSVEALNDILADAPFLKSYGFQRVKGQLKNQGEANVENEATAKGLI